MNLSLTSTTLEDVVLNGKYYNPAYSHYGYKTNVVCDRCKRTNLDICIGYKDQDLCFNCVDIINSLMTNKIVTNKIVKEDSPYYVTKMLDNKFSKGKANNPNYITLMLDDKFSKGKVDNPNYVTRMVDNAYGNKFGRKKVITRMSDFAYYDNNDK